LFRQNTYANQCIFIICINVNEILFLLSMATCQKLFNSKHPL